MQTSTIENKQTSELEEFGIKLRKCVTSGTSGPLAIAADVVKLAAVWSAHKDEADGLTCSQWLIGICGAGKGLAWWEKRDAAVKRIGEHARRRLDHNVAVFVSNNVSDEFLKPVCDMLLSSMKQNAGNPLTIAQAKLRIAIIVGKKAGKKTCAQCRRLESIIKSHGLDPNEQIH